MNASSLSTHAVCCAFPAVQGAGCFDFSSIQPEDCSRYDSTAQPPMQQPEGHKGDPDDPLYNDDYKGKDKQQQQGGNKTLADSKEDYNPYMRVRAVARAAGATASAAPQQLHLDGVHSWEGRQAGRQQCL